MITDTVELKIGRASKDGKYLYLGLDEKGCLAKGEAKALLRVETNVSINVEAKMVGERRWHSHLNGLKPKDLVSELGTKDINFIAILSDWVNFLVEMVSLYNVAEVRGIDNPFALPEKEPRIFAGVVEGMSPEETGRRHYVMYGGEDIRRVAFANRSAFKDDPEAVGRANTASFGTSDAEKANQCSFGDDFESIGLANRGVYKDNIMAVAMTNDSIAYDHHRGSSYNIVLARLNFGAFGEDLEKLAECIFHSNNCVKGHQSDEDYAKDVKDVIEQLKIMFPGGAKDDDKIIQIIRKIGSTITGDKTDYSDEIRFLTAAIISLFVTETAAKENLYRLCADGSGFYDEVLKEIGEHFIP